MIAPYPDYRDWPESWLPQIPSHWRAGALRHFITFETGWTPPTQDDAAYSGDNKWANISDLGPRTLMDTAKHLSNTAVAGHRPVRAGALLFSFKLSVGAVSRAGAEMFTNEAIAAFRGSDEVDLGYAYYAFPEFIPRNANTNIYGAKLLNGSLIRHAPLALPPVEEQRTIADYLDRETVKIDTLIDEQQQLIEMLRERRQAVISHAVLEATSRRVALRRVTDVIDCAHVTADFVDDDNRFPVASIRECTGAYVDLSSCNYTTSEYFELLRASGRAPRPGDLLFIRNVSVGLVSAIAPGTPEFAVGQETVLLRRKTDIDPIFLRYALNGSEVRHAVDGAMIGSTFRRINVSAIRALPIPLPQLDEQRRIVAFLDEQITKIDELIAETERFIELSKERRAALITAAVTGQIDVRDQVGVGAA